MPLQRMALRGKIEATKTDGALAEREVKDVEMHKDQSRTSNKRER